VQLSAGRIGPPPISPGRRIIARRKERLADRLHPDLVRKGEVKALQKDRLDFGRHPHSTSRSKENYSSHAGWVEACKATSDAIAEGVSDHDCGLGGDVIQDGQDVLRQIIQAQGLHRAPALPDTPRLRTDGPESRLGNRRSQLAEIFSPTAQRRQEDNRRAAPHDPIMQGRLSRTHYSALPSLGGASEADAQDPAIQVSARHHPDAPSYSG
jgi:hypothetical protein